jgi:hypothetical protein
MISLPARSIASQTCAFSSSLVGIPLVPSARGCADDTENAAAMTIIPWQ